MKIVITVKDTDNVIGLKEDVAMRLEGVADIVRIDTADVVPKSEVDMSQHLLKDAWKRIEELDELCGELQKSKTEVAREIFEEVEEAISAMEYNAKSQTKNATIPIDSMTDVVNWVLHEVVPNRISELKNKYTGGNNG